MNDLSFCCCRFPAAAAAAAASTLESSSWLPCSFLFLSLSLRAVPRLFRAHLFPIKPFTDNQLGRRALQERRRQDRRRRRRRPRLGRARLCRRRRRQERRLRAHAHGQDVPPRLRQALNDRGRAIDARKGG